jgi:thioredoxin 1
MAGANMINLTSKNFAAEVLQHSTPIVVDFWAEWCGPCKALGPLLDELATEYAGRVRIGKVNIDNEQDLATQYHIQSIPSLLFFAKGQVTEQVVGLRSKKELQRKFDHLTA